MSGPKTPEPESGAQQGPEDDAAEPRPYPQAYSAPESEQFSSGPYVPVDPDLYDYDSYLAEDDDAGPPRWPWVVGVTAIVAAIVLVVSVALLVARTETTEVATPSSTTSAPPVWNEIPTTTQVPPPAPPPSTEESPPPSSEPETSEPPPTAEPTATAEVPPETPPATPSTTLAVPRQLTYSVTGTKAPFDQITITYTDSTGNHRTYYNVVIPWSITLTPISTTDFGSLEASSLLGFSRLNCSITWSDGSMVSSNANNAPRTNC